MKIQPLKIKTCEYRDYQWHIHTECHANRTVAYYELKNEMCDEDGMVKDLEFDFEGKLDKPMTFDYFVEIMNMSMNRAQLWLRLELILYKNEVKRWKGAEIAAAWNEVCEVRKDFLQEVASYMNDERRKRDDQAHHERIERMIEQLDIQSAYQNIRA